MSTNHQAGRPDKQSDAPAPCTSKGRQWPILIVSLLSLNVCICAITITAATTHPARVEPDYYEKAVNWDKHRGIVPANQSEVTDPAEQAEQAESDDTPSPDAP